MDLETIGLITAISILTLEFIIAVVIHEVKSKKKKQKLIGKEENKENATNRNN